MNGFFKRRVVCMEKIDSETTSIENCKQKDLFNRKSESFFIENYKWDN